MTTVRYFTNKTKREFPEWSWTFCEAYAIERYYNDLSHRLAFREAMRNPLVRHYDKPNAPLY